MSNRHWPVYGIGLVLTDAKLTNGKTEIDTIVHALGVDNADELRMKMENSDHVWEFYDARKECKFFTSFADNKPFDEEPERMLVIRAKNVYEPFRAAYSGPEEIRKEFQDIIGKYMPEDFDWDAHIGEFSGTIYC